MNDNGEAANHRRRRQHGNPFNIRGELVRPDWPVIFRRTAPFALDIGCGPGAFVLELARTRPELDVIGLEIRQHLVDEVNQHAALHGLRNVYALLANANVHLLSLVPPASVMMVSINFPDPWYKKRHHKRRVVQPQWAEQLVSRLCLHAEIHVMTDYEPLGREICATFDATPGLVNLSGKGGFAAVSSTGINSERERTHERRGEPIYRLHFRHQLA